MKRGHIPIRTCRGCGRKVQKLELVRLAMVNGALVEDPAQIVAGRGVYCCRNELCRTRLKKNKKTLRRLLRLQD
jgi:predicted RNA-binding protein YlxR (DUF448 family)